MGRIIDSVAQTVTCSRSGSQHDMRTCPHSHASVPLVVARLPPGTLGSKCSWILFLLWTSSRNLGPESFCHLGHVSVPEHCNHCGKGNECTEWLKPGHGVPAGTEVQHHPNQVYWSTEKERFPVGKESGSISRRRKMGPASCTQLSPPTCLSHCSPSLPFSPFSSAHKSLSIPLKTWLFLSFLILTLLIHLESRCFRSRLPQIAVLSLILYVWSLPGDNLVPADQSGLMFLVWEDGTQRNLV